MCVNADLRRRTERPAVAGISKKSMGILGLGNIGRAALAARYREQVLRHHTYEHRAETLIGLLRRREDLPSFCIKIGAPDWARGE